MKKLTLTTAILLGLALTTLADNNNQDGGLFQRGASTEEMEYANRDAMPALPTHGLQNNQDATSPIGSGIAVLLGFGGAYLLGKKRRQE